MKLKSTLWALAFACIAMSCSDDELTGPGSENEGGSGSATTAQMKVIISAGTGTSTKANEAEQGDNNEQGSYDEYQVKDIAVFLYKGAEKPTSGPLSLDGSKEIVAMGYTADTNEQQTTNPTNHEWEATIKVQVSDKDMKTFAGQKFGVIALTNITEDSYGAIKAVLSTQTTNTVQHLADYLQSGIHTDNGFVMSTHMMDDTGSAYGSGSGSNYSIVEFPENPNSSTAIPTVECYVERLAAKVRINQPKSGNGTVETDGYKYQIGSTGDYVTLTAAAVINQLTSGEYLLKRVSEEQTADWNLSGNCKLLGDEVYTNNGGTITANFVADPWTTQKVKNSIVDGDGNLIIDGMANDKTVSFNLQTSSMKLAYNNHIAMTDGATTNPQTLNYGAFWNAITSPTVSDSWVQAQLKPKDLTGSSPITLAYTMENTVNVANSLNALMTGVMFKAKYEPEKVSDIKDDNQSIEEVNFSNADGTFYTYGNIKFASLEAIFAYELALNATGQSSNMLYWKDFYDNDTNGSWKDLTVAKFKSYIATFGSTTYLDSFEYLKYLNEQVSSLSDTDKVSEKGIQTFGDYIIGKTLPTKVKEYKKGTCYYFYWIRHEDNDNPTVVGPMEYAIVRNNIYDLTVSSISGLGEAAIDVPTPSEPAETVTATIEVTLKVRNWVVRKNDNIIL